MNEENKEIEVRFLEIDKQALIDRLKGLGAEDHGEELLEEIIFYDKDLAWLASGKRLRLRKTSKGLFLSYKNHFSHTVDGTEEIEFMVSDARQAEVFMDRIGFPAYRHQQKWRHSFKLGDVVADIDTWPRVPPYVEIEGPSEGSLKEAAKKLNLDWRDVVLDPPSSVIEDRYHIPVRRMRWFTFDRFE
jgi:adenylate cyclase class 2